MTTNRAAMKCRSVTYPNSDKQSSVSSSFDYSYASRGKLKRMDSVDSDTLPNTFSSQLPINRGHHLPHQSQSVTGCRSSLKHRDLSVEGKLRTKHFHQAHSGSSLHTPSQRILRFSDGYIGRSGSQSMQDTHTRSLSCAPLNKNKSSTSPMSSNANLERLVDWPSDTSISVFGSTDQHEHLSQTKRHPKDKRLSKYNSTDCQNLPVSRMSSTETTATSSSGSPPATNDSDARSRRSQFRRAISLFSLSCDKETERDRKDKAPQKILRPPTRHVYRRGVSGLPIECTSRSLGMAY